MRHRAGTTSPNSSRDPNARCHPGPPNRWTRRAVSRIVTGMSKAQKAGGSEEAPDLSFGDALQKLQAVVEEMEGDDLPLEALLTRYEEGMKLARVCEAKLSRAEVRIQQLEQTAAGELKLKPFAVTDTETDTV